MEQMGLGRLNSGDACGAGIQKFIVQQGCWKTGNVSSLKYKQYYLLYMYLERVLVGKN